MNKALILLVIIFGLLLAALVTTNADFIWLALLCCAYWGVGFLQSPATHEIKLSATRSVEKNTTNALTTLDVSVTIANEGTALVRLVLSDPIQFGMSIKEGQTTQTALLQAGENAIFKYTFQSERGSFAWKTIQAKLSDSFGLFETEYRFAGRSKDLDTSRTQQVSPLSLALSAHLAFGRLHPGAAGRKRNGLLGCARISAW